MKSIIKKLILTLTVIVIIAWGGLVAAKYYMIPAAIQSGAQDRTGEIWAGELAIGEVAFSYFKPIFISEIVLTDPSGVERVRCEAIRISLGRWHYLKPAITEVDIAKLYLRPEIEPGGIIMPGAIWPAKEDENEREENEEFDTPLQSVEVRDCTVEIDHHDETMVLPGNSLSFSQENNKLSLIFSYADGQDYLQLNGTITPRENGAMDSTFRLTTDQMVKRDLVEVFFTLAGVAPEYDGKARINGSAEITGDLKNRQNMLIDGDFQISRGEMYVRGQQVLQQFDATVELEAEQLEIDQFRGVFCSGSLDGSFRMGLKQFKPDYYNLEYQIKDTDLTALGDAFAPFAFLEGGTGTMAFGIEGYAGKEDSVTGEGSAAVTDADIRTFPVLSAVLSVMQLNKLDPVKISDLGAHFEIEGPVLRFDQASVSNPMTAIDMQPGGTFNVKTGQVDCYVVGMPLHKVESTLASIPVLNLFTQLKDTLVRLRVQGHYQDPPAKLVSKQPVSDLGKGTLEFFQGVVKTGGDLPGQVLDTIFSPFQSRQNQADEKKGTETGEKG